MFRSFFERQYARRSFNPLNRLYSLFTFKQSHASLKNLVVTNASYRVETGFSPWKAVRKSSVISR